ncbi:MAG: biotin-dependent carboxyltransferase family protein [Tissierellia bacterium]|nr:biotin-dependent carboxyltransferase family protein [Tissierellia bacterium]
MNKIIITKAGLLTTIQDRGRWGYQQYGISVAGAMDQFAMNVANLIVGNNKDAAVLECTYSGPEIEFCCDESICLTGADMDPKINGNPVQMWTSLLLRAGDKLTLKGAKNGLRSYIAFSRQLDVSLIMGSKSTYIRGKLGGLHGDKLSAGDEIGLGEKDPNYVGSYLSKEHIPNYKSHANLRVVMGPQDDCFTEEALWTFLNSTYCISTDADRMGYRLDGPTIQHIEGADIISDGIVMGSIQVPGNGLPIIMMSDRQTTGGYTKIATVITSDLSTLAQMGPGSTVEFSRVSVEESHSIYKGYMNKLTEIEAAIKSRRFELVKTRSFVLTFQEKIYNVEVNEIL